MFAFEANTYLIDVSFDEYKRVGKEVVERLKMNTDEQWVLMKYIVKFQLRF